MVPGGWTNPEKFGTRRHQLDGGKFGEREREKYEMEQRRVLP